jgi:Polysaccharide deacetylase
VRDHYWLAVFRVTAFAYEGGVGVDEVTPIRLGKPPRWFRPPGGDYDEHVAEVAEALGYTMVLWTDDPGDYASPGQGVVLSRTLNTVDNGGILLLHDGIQETLDVLPQIIETLQQRGYQFVTIDEMMAARQREREGLPSNRSYRSIRIARRRQNLLYWPTLPMRTLA